MKRIALLLSIIAAFAGPLSAQAATAPKAQDAQPAVSKLEGKLALVNGEIGIQAKDKTYYLGIPRRLFGFIDGLKEGAQVKLEGYEYSNALTPGYVRFRVTKLAVNGKEYDLSQYGARGGPRDGGMACDGRGPGNDNGGRGQGRGNGGSGGGRGRVMGSRR